MGRKRFCTERTGIPVCALALCLTGLILALSSGRESRGESTPATNNQGRLGEIECKGQMRYRMGNSPWVTQAQGSYPILTPLFVRTNNAQSHITFVPSHIFEVGRDTEFEMREGGKEENDRTVKDPDTSDVLKMLLKNGMFLYGVPSSSSVVVEFPSYVEGVAIAGIQPDFKGRMKSRNFEALTTAGVVRADFNENEVFAGLAPRTFDESVSHIGVLQIEGTKIRLYNVKGTLVYYDNDTSIVLQAGEWIEIVGGKGLKGMIAGGALAGAAVGGGTTLATVGAIAAVAVIGGATFAIADRGNSDRKSDRDPVSPSEP